MWASPLVADGKVYLGDEDGDVVIMAHSKEPQLLAEMNMRGAVYGTVVPAHGTLFLNNRSKLFAIESRVGRPSRTAMFNVCGHSLSRCFSHCSSRAATLPVAGTDAAGRARE